MRRTARIGLAVALVAALAALLVVRLVTAGQPAADVRLDEFSDRMTAGQVESAAVDGGAGIVTGRIRTDTGGFAYTVRIAPDYADEMTDKLLAAPNQIQVTAVTSGPSLADVVLAALPYVLLAALVVWVLLRSPGGSRLLERLRRKRVVSFRPDVTFRDVAGLDEAVRELREITDFLANPASYSEIGARIPRGVLLYGPPGSGKTLLARAVAGEAGVPFYSLSGSAFVEMFAGVGAARVRDLFKRAKGAGAAIVFIDEIDAVGRARTASAGGSGDEREQTLNQLLVEMDGFFRASAIVVMAATNRPDILDPALLRPGRFDRHVAVDLPDVNGRRRILELHAKKVPVTAAVDFDLTARRTAGFSGADLANVVNEAALLAAREGRKLVSPDDLSEATERVLAGPERSRVLSDAERFVTAVHEAGHAVCGHVLPGNHRVDKVSIVGRGSALGFTMVLPHDDRTLLTRTEYLDELTVLLGGRAAEEVVLGEPTNGASDDLARATRKAREMVCELGMSAKLGPRTFTDAGTDPAAAVTISAELAAAIDREIGATVAEAHAAAKAIVVDRREVLDGVVTRLLEVESLEGGDLEAFLGSRTETGLLGRSDLWPTVEEGGDEPDRSLASG